VSELRQQRRNGAGSCVRRKTRNEITICLQTNTSHKKLLGVTFLTDPNNESALAGANRLVKDRCRKSRAILERSLTKPIYCYLNFCNNFSSLFHFRKLAMNCCCLSVWDLKIWVFNWATLQQTYLAHDRREGGNKRCFCPSICPSVRLSVRPSRTSRIIRESKGLACPNMEGSPL